MEPSLSRPALGPLRALLPLGIGLTVVGWMVARTLEEQGGWSALEGTVTLPGWPMALALMVLLVLLRDGGYVLRLRWLSNGDLTWRQAIETTVLWEFASAITPGIVGGGAVAIWGLHRQGMTAGRSTAVVFSTALLDELFYVLAVPPLLLVLGEAVRPDATDHAGGGTVPRGGNRLVGPLAAGHRVVGRRQYGLAGPRQRRHQRDEIDVDRAEDGNHRPIRRAISSPAVSSPACGRAPTGSGGGSRRSTRRA